MSQQSDEPVVAPAPAVPAAPVAVPVVRARRCDGSVATVLGRAPTAADPWFFNADNGTTYVVKVATAGNRTAFNEVFFGTLARRLGLRAPEVVAIDVSGDLIADDPQLHAAAFPAGNHVAIAKLPNGAIDLRGRPLHEYATNFKIENENELPGTVVYSSWIEDHDHKGNDGNWMLEPIPHSPNSFIAWIIDFGHALRGSDWSPATLAEIADPATVKQLGPHPLAAQAFGRHALDQCVDQISGLGVPELAALLAAVPNNWEPNSAAERDGLSACLLGRRPGLQQFKRNR